MNLIEIAEALDSERADRDILLSEVAAGSGYSYSAVRRLLKYADNARICTVMDVADFLGFELVLRRKR